MASLQRPKLLRNDAAEHVRGAACSKRHNDPCLIGLSERIRGANRCQENGKGNRDQPHEIEIPNMEWPDPASPLYECEPYISQYLPQAILSLFSIPTTTLA